MDPEVPFDFHLAERAGLFAAAPIIPRLRSGPSAPGRADVLRRRFRGGSSNPIVNILGFEFRRDNISWIALPGWKPLKKTGGREGFEPIHMAMIY